MTNDDKKGADVRRFLDCCVINRSLAKHICWKGINPPVAEYVLSEFSNEKLQRAIANNNEQFLVSENEEGIDGYVRLSLGKFNDVEGCSSAEIATLYIQPRHHKKGIGKALLRSILVQCWAQGYFNPWLMVNEHNTQARDFYVSQGFKAVGEKYFVINDGKHLNHIMTMDLLRTSGWKSHLDKNGTSDSAN